MPEVRLIDAYALIGFLHNQIFIDGDDRSLVYKWIEDQPTIEAEPVRHGRWELKMLGIGGGDKIRAFQCSECNRYANFKFDFCPNCGAKMLNENN